MLRLEAVRKLPQGVHLHPRNQHHQRRDPVNFLRALLQVPQLLNQRAPLHRVQLLRELLQVLTRLDRVFEKILAADVKHARHLVDQQVLDPDKLDRGTARNRLDPTDPSRDAPFAEKNKRPDLRRIGNVRPAAELRRNRRLPVKNAQHADPIAIFFVENRHDPFVHRVVQILDRRRDWISGEDILINDPFDLRKLLRRQRAIRIKVKAEPVGRNERTRLTRLIADNPMKRRVKKMRRGMIRLNIAPPLQVDFDDGRLPSLDRPGNDRPGMQYQPVQRPSDILHLKDERPVRRPDRPGIADLPAHLQIQIRRADDQLRILALANRRVRSPVGQRQQQRRFHRLALIRIIADPLRRKLPAGNQLVQVYAVPLGLLAGHPPDRLSRARSDPMRLGGGPITLAIDVEPLIADEIVSDLDRKPMRRVQVKTDCPVDNRLSLGAHPRQDLVQLMNPGVERLIETLLLRDQPRKNRVMRSPQLRISVLIRFDNRFRDLVHERFGQAQLMTEADRAPDDHAADIISPDIPRNDPVGDQERRRPRMVADHAVRSEIRRRLRVVRPGQPLNRFQRSLEQVGPIVGIDALKNRDDPLEPHPRVDESLRQWEKLVRTDAVILNENQVPELQEPRTIAIYGTDVPGDVPLIAVIRPQIDMNLGTGTAGTRIRHLPEIFLAPEIEDMIRIHPRLTLPDFECLRVSFDLPALVLETGRPQLAPVQPPDLGQQRPGPFDRFLLVIIAEGPVPQHLKKRMVRIVPTNLVEIIMLPRYAHAFLAVSGAFILPLIRSQKNVLKLNHAGVGKQDRLVADRNEGGGANGGMAPFDEKINELFSNIVAGKNRMLHVLYRLFIKMNYPINYT